MRWLFLVIVCSTPVQADELQALVDNHAETLTKERPTAALVVGIVHGEKDRVLTYGKCGDKSPDANSIYEIGSVTKVFTGILLAACVTAGVVKLDDPVQKHLPDGWKMPRRDDRDITLLHLATHTSGLPRTPKGFLIASLADPLNPFGKFDQALMLKELPGTELKHAIGARFEYSNLGAGLLGHALAHACKAKSYEEALVGRVLEPLGLADTRITLNAMQKKHLLPGFDDKGKPRPNWDFPCLEACGGLRSTVADMMKFLRVNLAPAGPRKDALEMAQRPWREIRPDEEDSGLGWVRYKSPRSIWHNGQTGGYHSFVGFVPGKGGVVILCNVATMKVDDLGFRVLKYFAEGK